MSIEAHIQSIANKRGHIKQEIASEMAHACPNFQRITYLKKQNLALKEEMQRYFKLLKPSATGS